MNFTNPHLRFFIAELEKENVKYKIYEIPLKNLSRIPPNIKRKIEKMHKIAQMMNCHFGVVGGFVRDLLLGYELKDVDFIVFHGDFQAFTETVAKKLKGKIAKMSNKTFTTQIRFRDGTIFEFNATRKERYQYPSRMPIVEKGSVIEDLYRRDFTVNALVLFDNVYVDIFDGTKDLKELVIRTARDPEIVFKEDYLRMFRAIRFSCTLDFHIAEEVKRGIMENAQNLNLVPKERILAELKLAIKAKPLKCYNLMRELKIFEVLFPKIPNRELENKEEFNCNTVWEKIAIKLRYLQQQKVQDEIVLLSAIISEMEFNSKAKGQNKSKIKARDLKENLIELKFSNKEIKRFLLYIRYVDMLFDLAKHDVDKFTLRKFMSDVYSYLEHIIILARAEQQARKKETVEQIINKLLEISKQEELINVKLAIDGNTIRKILAVEGAEIGRIKQSLIDAIMAEKVKNTKRELIKYLKNQVMQLKKDCASNL